MGGDDREDLFLYGSQRHAGICAGGLDGKRFPVSEAQPGTNYPPMHPWCRSTTMPDMSAEQLRKVKRAARDPKTGKSITVPGDMTYREWYRKYVEGQGKPDFVNQARPLDAFSYSADEDDAQFKKIDILSEMQSSPIGRKVLDDIGNSKARIQLVVEKQWHSARGEQHGDDIKIYLANIKNKRVAAQTVIHEMTHYRYRIGNCQHAEAVCFAMEKMHIAGRDYLTQDEWQYVKRLAIDNYPEYNWEKGGYGNYEQFDFVK